MHFVLKWLSYFLLSPLSGTCRMLNVPGNLIPLGRKKSWCDTATATKIPHWEDSHLSCSSSGSRIADMYVSCLGATLKLGHEYHLK